ncbi:MAG: isoprenylcysteine carboxylmethyltransferase family protein [Acidobacteriota bacterium]
MANISDQNIAAPFRLLLKVPVPWVYVLGYLIGVALEFIFPLHLVPAEAFITTKIVGGVIFILGAIIAGWSLLKFYRSRTTTTPGEISKEFVTHGFYRFTRNPMYVGLILAYIGDAGMWVQIWPLVTLPLVIAYLNWVVIPLEESRLVEHFGSDYEAYRLKVRRWI